jgi:hypothetical protein
MKIGRGKPAPAPLCPPQIPLDQTWAWTRAAAMGSQRLTAWAMARPHLLCNPNVCPHKPVLYPTMSYISLLVTVQRICPNHSECKINKGLIQRGSTIDHWRSQCERWILWPTPYTHTHVGRYVCMFLHVLPRVRLSQSTTGNIHTNGGT